jgi:hypothetical protein
VSQRSKLNTCYHHTLNTYRNHDNMITSGGHILFNISEPLILAVSPSRKISALVPSTDDNVIMILPCNIVMKTLKHHDGVFHYG